MARLGADAAALSELGTSMRLAARTLETIAGDLDRRVRSSGWHGRDADRFLRHWSVAHRSDLRSCADRLGQLGHDLRTQADQQRAASAATGEGRSGGPIRSGPPTAPAPPAPRLAPLPRSEFRYLGGIDVTIGLLSVALSGTVTIQELPDGRSRVVWTETAGVGGTAGVGATAQLSISDETFSGAPTAGFSADGTARVGPLVRRSWEVDRDRVDDLLVGLALDTGARAGVVPVDAVVSAGGIVDRVVRHFSGFDPNIDDQIRSFSTPPPADHTEQMFEVVVTGGIGSGMAGALGVGGQANSTGSLRAGVAHTNGGPADRRHLVVETSGTTAGVISSTLLRRLGVELPSSARVVSATRFEVPIGEGHPADSPITLHLSAGDGAEITEVRAAISGAPSLAAGDELAASVRSMARGDLDSALARITAIDLSELSVEVAVSNATVEGTSARSSASISAGLRAGAGARGQVLEIRR